MFFQTDVCNAYFSRAFDKHEKLSSDTRREQLSVRLFKSYLCVVLSQCTLIILL